MHLRLAVTDGDEAGLEVLLQPAGDGELVADRVAETAVLVAGLAPGLHDRAVAHRPGTRQRAPVDVAALEPAVAAEVLQRQLRCGREAEPAVLETHLGVLAEDKALHAVRAGGGAEIHGPAFEALHGAVTVGRLDLRAGRITGRT